jgi:hypothetical protein
MAVVRYGRSGPSMSEGRIVSGSRACASNVRNPGSAVDVSECANVTTTSPERRRGTALLRAEHTRLCPRV